MPGLAARRQKITVDLETTYNDGTVPAQDIETSDLKLTPLAGPRVDRNRDRSQLGNDLNVLVGSYCMLEFKVELSCSGAAGTAPIYRPCLLAAGLAETVVASTSVTYNPIDESFDSAAIRYNQAGNRHGLRGVRGSCSLMLDAGTLPKLGFRLFGLYETPVAEAAPADNFAQNPALAVNNANSTFSLHGVSSVMEKLSLGWNIDFDYRNVVGDEYIAIYDNAPSGTVEYETPLISTKNWYETARTNALGALAFTHDNGGAGHLVAVNAPQVQVTEPNLAGDNISLLAAGLTCIDSAGNDALTLVYT